MIQITNIGNWVCCGYHFAAIRNRAYCCHNFKETASVKYYPEVISTTIDLFNDVFPSHDTYQVHIVNR